jgi:serine protease Do
MKKINHSFNQQTESLKVLPPTQRIQRMFIATFATACLVFSVSSAMAADAANEAVNSAAVVQVTLPDFTQIVEKSENAVVNIRTTALVAVPPAGGGNSQDPYEMFRRFFGPDFNIPGMPNPKANPHGGGGGNAPSPAPQERSVPRGVGSGFFISENGSILTNHHVITDADEIIVTLTDGREFKAKVVGSDERTDVALLQVDAKDMATLPIGDPKTLKKGQWVLAIGSPFGLESTVTSGIVSAIGRETGDYLPFIQTDVAVNPGNSGGPLLDLKGQVVGINSQIVSRSGGFMGISLAIPIDEAMMVVAQLQENGRVTRGRLGVQIGEVSQEVAQAIGLPKAEGAMISAVMPDSPAQKAGIEAGDIVLKFDNKPIKKWSDLPRVVGSTKPDSSVKVEVWRKGKVVILTAKVGEVKAPVAEAKADQKTPEAKAKPTVSALGITVVPLSDEAKKELKLTNGIEVTAVTGEAANAGINEGDVILTLGNTDITSPEQFVSVAGKLDQTKAIGVMVRRGEQTQWVLLKPTTK